MKAIKKAFQLFDDPVFHGRALVILMGLMLLNLCVDTFSYRDRARIKAALADQRKMLDARASIQIMLIRRNWTSFTPEERKFIEDNWRTAEYNLAQGK